MTDTDTSNIGKAGKTHAKRTQVNEMHKAGQSKAKRETHRRTHAESETWLALFRGEREEVRKWGDRDSTSQRR